MVQKWFDIRNTTALDVVKDGNSLSQRLVKLSKVLETTFLDNPLKAAVTPVACAPLSTNQLSINML